MLFYFTQFTIKIRDIMSNETNRNIYNLIILDESGSMESIKSFIISGFNELVQGTKSIQEESPEQQHLISLVSFNTSGIKYLLWNEPVSKLEPINEQTYNPNNMTPLYDAIGQSVSRLKEVLPSHTPWNVLVTILTDGEENASREYSGQKIREIIESLKPNGWVFTYIGANHDVEAAAARMSITNTMDYEASDFGVDVLFNKEIAARSAFSKRVSKNARVGDLNRDYYESKED
jgi:Mg-chelatase subunit ChlD